MKLSVKAAATAVAISILSAAAPASAAVILTTADGVGADTHISNDTNEAATTNQGGDGSNAIRHYDGTRAKASYYKFDLSNVTGDLSGATLTFTFTSANRTRTMNVYGLVDESGDAWGETTIAYNNAPGVVQPADGGAEYNTGFISFDPAKLSVVTEFTTPAAPGTITTTADTDVDAFLAADTNDLVTFALYTASSDSSQSFFVASKESTNGVIAYPTLTLPNATLVPEPGALSLGGVLAVAGLARRRRR